jgi:adenylate kinase
VARTSSEWVEAAIKVMTSGETNLRKLAQLAGGNPRTFYRGANLRGADLRGQDLRDMDFAYADLNEAIIDGGTRFGRSINLVLMGPPGAGKGVQASHLVTSYDLLHASTGDILRQAVRAETALGLIAKAIMSAGELVNDANVSALIEEWLDGRDNLAGVVFDGHPRTEAQAVALEKILGQRGIAIDLVIVLDVDETVLVDRISGRFTCATCGEIYHEITKPPKLDTLCDCCGGSEFKRRADDNEETARARMWEYRTKTAPIIPIFEARGLVRRVDGNLPIREVSERIDALLYPLLIENGQNAAHYHG